MKKRKLLALLLAAALCLSLFPTALAAGEEETAPAQADWTVCVYMCGSDLESDNGAATNDLLEMLEAAPGMPEGFRLLVLTGGSEKWNPNNYSVSADTGYIAPADKKIELFEIAVDSGAGKMNLRNHQFSDWLVQKNRKMPDNMGDPETAISFFEYAVEEAPSEHMMVVFWDHGSGASGGGCCFDRVSGDHLNMNELDSIISELHDKRGRKLDLVGFDACLMSELATATVLSDDAEYLLASEEAEPDTGWDYSWLSALSGSSIDATVIAKAVIDYYPDVSGGVEVGEGRWSKATMETLALTDLSKVGTLAVDFDLMMGAVREIDPNHLAALDSVASRSQASAVMPVGVDLYDFASNIVKAYTDAEGEWRGHADIAGDYSCNEKCSQLLHAAENVVEDFRGEGASNTSLAAHSEKVVAYRGRGSAAASGGISVFYPLGGPVPTKQIAKTYASISPNYADWLDWLQKLENSEDDGRFDGSLDLIETQGVGAELDYVLNISPASALDNVASVKAVVTYTNVKTGDYYVLGESDIDNPDWVEARFQHEFPETWYAINDQFVSLDSGWSMEMEDGVLYKLFRIPAYVDNKPAYVIARVDVSRLEELGKHKGNLDAAVYGFSYANSSGSSDSISSRITLLDESEGSLSFRPVLAGDLYDTETWDARDVVTVQYKEDGFDLNLSKKELASGSEQFYTAYFQITDLAGGRILSDPIPFYVIERLSQLAIKPIPPQIYDGEPIDPDVTFLFMGHEVLTDKVDYIVEWDNNVEVGTATGVITPIQGGELDQSDTREVTFEICHERDWTKKYIEWMASILPDHLPGQEFEISETQLMGGYEDLPHDEYVIHSLLAEELKELYELHTDPADRKLFQESGLVSKMEAHYAAATEDVTTTDNGVEMFGVLRLVRTLFPYHEPDGHFETEVTDGAPDFEKTDDPADFRRYYEEARRDVENGNSKAVAVKSYNPIFMQRATVYEAADYLVNMIMSLPEYENMTPVEAAEMRQEYIAYFLEARRKNLEEQGKADEIDTAEPYCWMSLTMSGYGVDSNGLPPTATLKIPVPSGYDADSLRVYRVTADGADYMFTSCATENGRKFVVFETDVMSPSDCWFTLFAAPEGSGNQGGTSGGGGGSGKPSVKPGAETAKPDTPTTTPSGGVAGFNDVASSAWYADYVRYVVERGLFGGVGNGNFAPDANMTRAMMWTVLARYMGVDTSSGSSWYAAARDWAVAQGISDGTMADGNVTREQFVTMLWRLSGEPAAPSSASFTDGGSVSGYARAAVDWAVSVGIVSGYNDGAFKPQGSATRAEVAKMLTVFCTNVEVG